MHNSSSLSFSFELVVMISLDRNDREVINLLFALPGLCSNTRETEKILQLWDKKFVARQRKWFNSQLVVLTRNEQTNVSLEETKKKKEKRNQKLTTVKREETGTRLTDVRIIPGILGPAAGGTDTKGSRFRSCELVIWLIKITLAPGGKDGPGPDRIPSRDRPRQSQDSP